MFMFRFRSRKNIIRQLAKARKRRPPAMPEDLEDDDGGVHGLLRRLQKNQLEMLLQAVENRGRDRDAGDCVLLACHGVGGAGQQEPPHVVCCQSWRWPDLRQAGELRRLPTCRSACDPVYVCCNPYHWSRLCQPETPPPPYSRTNSDRIKPEDRAPSEVAMVCRDSYQGSLTTNGDSCINSSEWCKLAYWELSERVGPLYPVEPPAVNVFGNVSHPDGLNLETLAQHSFSPPESSVQKTRRKIGLGITLSREGDRIWVYNRSDHPIFVNSPTLQDRPDQATPTRVPADHCVCAYDAAEAGLRDLYASPSPHLPPTGPVDPHSLRISFAKGWGPKYSRREITSCPCWLEILLAPCR